MWSVGIEKIGVEWCWKKNPLRMVLVFLDKLSMHKDDDSFGFITLGLGLGLG